jgi:hypothetical protein
MQAVAFVSYGDALGTRSVRQVGAILMDFRCIIDRQHLAARGRKHPRRRAISRLPGAAGEWTGDASNGVRYLEEGLAAWNQLGGYSRIRLPSLGLFHRATLCSSTLMERGNLSAATRGSMHGEIGHTQFLPKNILNYGVGGSLDIAANALASTANFLKAHGWRAGAGYQPGDANFVAIQAWNAAPVYQRAIAIIGRQLDGG